VNNSKEDAALWNAWTNRQPSLFYICLEGHVAQYHLLHKITFVLDFSDVRNKFANSLAMPISIFRGATGCQRRSTSM
jgi:hypothetical protein